MVESIDDPDLMAQRHVDRVVSAVGRAFKEVRAHPQGETVPLEYKAEPANVLLPAKVLAGVGNPDITTGGNGVAQSGDHLLNLGQIIGRSGLPDLEGEDPGDDHAVLGRPEREHLRLLLGGRIPQDKHSISFRLCHRSSPLLDLDVVDSFRVVVIAFQRPVLQRSPRG